MLENKSYNQRLFQSGLRKYFHLSRFNWLKAQLNKLDSNPSIIELGCYDLRSLDYFPKSFSKYTGFDANWENGLDLARKKFNHDNKIELIESYDFSTFNPVGKFDIAIALETLEHLKSDQLSQYLSKLFEISNIQIYTIPNEQGLVFLLKHLYKLLTGKYREKYSFKEFTLATLGFQDKVTRRECSHKGFSWRTLLSHLNQNYPVFKVEGIPFNWVPTSLNPTIGIIIKK